MPRKYDCPCAGCGKLLIGGKGSLPAGERCCQSCRATRQRPCGHCGAAFTATRSPGGYWPTTCSQRCGNAQRADGLRAAPGRRVCPCGTPTIGAKVLCDPCRIAIRRARWRRINAKRRGAISSSPPITIEMLGHRDGWRCHLCRKRVRADLRVPDPAAPTFDHLVPVSDGGTDDPANLRLAHLGCNSRRGNGGTVQLMLIG